MKAIFTNDDAGSATGAGAIEAFLMVVDWLDAQGIRGTFFWVPKPGRFGEAHELWDPAVREVRGRGHDFQLHGLTHGSCLEFGVPQASTRRANPAPFEEYEGNREHWEREHSVPSLLVRVQEGMAIYEGVFGERPAVFRAPCFGVCANMYEALAQAGIRHSSSRGVNPTATAYTITGDAALRRWAPDFPCRPWVEPPGVIEHACMEDLCLAGVPAEQAEDRLDLVLAELGHCMEEVGTDGAVVFGSHYHSMARTWEQTRPLYETAFAWMADRGVGEWVTFRDHVAGES